jgi:hypothetical protein
MAVLLIADPDDHNNQRVATAPRSAPVEDLVWRVRDSQGADEQRRPHGPLPDGRLRAQTGAATEVRP